MSALIKVLKLLMIIVLSSFFTTWTLSAMPLPNYGGAYFNGANKKPLVISNSQQAARLVKSQYGGKVLKVQRTKIGYKVKVLKDNGHVISVNVDAQSGRVSGR
jgi:hypothetical protein